MTNAPLFDGWLADFFNSYARRRPVNATFMGIHEYDHILPDYSAVGVAAALGDAESLLARLRSLPEEILSQAEALDRELATGFLEIQRWEYQSVHFLSGNPCVYTSEAAFGVISLLRRPFAPLEQRLEAATARMLAIPILLEQGRTNLHSAPAAWCEKALAECVGLRLLLRGGIERLLNDAGITHPEALAAAEQAALAVDAFEHFLREQLLQTDDGYACGPLAFDLLLRRGHFLAQSADEIERYAAEQVELSEQALQSMAAELGESDWKAALAKLADIHPPVEHYYGRYAELWQACRNSAVEHQLLSWPDFPVQYVPRPAWVREAAPHLYFLFYHSPAPYDYLAELEYLVTPIELDMPADQQNHLLRANNESVIKLNHVVHHGAIGHHVQNWHAARAAARIGRIAAVDCASRIAMLCGGTMAEGWACYATDLMAEYSFLTPLEQLSEQYTRLRMAARALSDVRLHHSRWTIEQAATFYQEHAGMTPSAARGEAIKNSMFPATALMYLIGTDAIHQLRRECATQPGFSLQSFHDTFLSYGSIPVALIAQAMTQAMTAPE